MQTKSFFIFSIIAIAIISVITSYISVLYLSKPVLMAGESGYISVGNVPEGSINVIVVDALTGATGIDTVNFGTVNKGTTVGTKSDGTGIKPFLINNTGQDAAKVCLKLENVFLSGATSMAYIGVEKAHAVGAVVPWSQLLDCGGTINTGGNCYTTSSYQTGTVCTPGTGAGCLALWSGITPIGYTLIIDQLNQYTTSTKSTAFLHVTLKVDPNEPKGSKLGTITVKGVSTSLTC
jgi:hypothetical protein